MTNVVNNLLKSEIVTPEGSVYSKNVYMITVPGSEGEFGVMVGHAPMLVALKPGLVVTYDENMQILDRIFIINGFAEVTNESTILLVDQSNPISNFNLEDVEKQLVELRNELKDCHDVKEQEKINKEIHITEELLLVLKTNN